MKKPAVPVTDHCVIRYMERVMGIDIEAVRQKIAADLAPAVRLGAVGLTKDGFNYRIQDGAVITVMPAGSGQRRYSVEGGGRMKIMPTPYFQLILHPRSLGGLEKKAWTFGATINLSMPSLSSGFSGYTIHWHFAPRPMHRLTALHFHQNIRSGNRTRYQTAKIVAAALSERISNLASSDLAATLISRCPHGGSRSILSQVERLVRQLRLLQWSAAAE